MSIKHSRIPILSLYSIPTLGRLFLLLLSFHLISCQSMVQVHQVELPKGKRAQFLSSEAARKAIVSDPIDGFFEKITLSDINIQLQRSLPDSLSRAQAVSIYQQSLQDNILDFSAEELEFLAPIIKEVAKKIQQINPALLPKNLKFIKTEGRHYGVKALYTRTQHIIIPKAALDDRDRDALRYLFSHHCFHIFSRYHPEWKAQLYQLIGFKALKIKAEQLTLPPNLANSMLINPDAVDYLYTICLTPWDQPTREFIPLSNAVWHHFNEGADTYLPNLSVYFAPIERVEKDDFRVASANLLDPDYIGYREVSQDLFRQIGQNTRYIIHPDEILAENFALIAMGHLQDSTKLKRIRSPELLKKIEGLLNTID